MLAVLIHALPDGDIPEKSEALMEFLISLLTRRMSLHSTHLVDSVLAPLVHASALLIKCSVEAHAKRAAAVMSLIQSARLNGHDPYAYLKDVLTRLPTQRNSMICELLPHRWQPQA